MQTLRSQNCFSVFIRLSPSNTYFLRQLKYLPITQGPQQTSTTYTYLDIKLPGYIKVLSIKEQKFGRK